jgi:hypothetical protein
MGLRPPPLTADELRALGDKYRRLAALRAGRDRDEPAGRDVLRVLAELHPGCLRELDALGLPELERRARVVTDAAAGGPVEPWMDWISAYHRLMRAALLIKRRVGRGTAPDAAARTRLLEEAQAIAGLPLDDGFLTEVTHPPQGRLAVLVLRRLGRLFGAPAAGIAKTLFPPRRASPYTLA